jgi:pilus assembly protein CpaB
MRSRHLLFAVFAGVFSLVVVAGSLLGQKGSESTPLRAAVVVSRDLDVGTTLSDEMLSIIQFPAPHLPPGVGTDPQQFSGRVLTRPMRKNQLLYPFDLAPDDSPLTLQSRISEGNRGYTIPLNTPSAGLAGFALPGSRVDVLSSPAARRGAEVGESSTVVENVVVLAVDNISVPEDVPSNPKTMTLLLSPEQTRRVDLAQAQGPLRLSLRNSRDLTISEPPESELVASPLTNATPRVVAPVSQSQDPEYRETTPLNVLVFRESVVSRYTVRRVVRKRPAMTAQKAPNVAVPSVPTP